MSKVNKLMSNMLLMNAMTSSMLMNEPRKKVNHEKAYRPERLIPREKTEEELQKRREHKKKIKARKNARRHNKRR